MHSERVIVGFEFNSKPGDRERYSYRREPNGSEGRRGVYERRYASVEDIVHVCMGAEENGSHVDLPPQVMAELVTHEGVYQRLFT